MECLSLKISRASANKQFEPKGKYSPLVSACTVKHAMSPFPQKALQSRDFMYMEEEWYKMNTCVSVCVS
uniref:Uncharacterized protein n=1 Tax=Anguilla anguilla TaxID=7936 RepID=A0A0E9X372_ANGAN